MTFQSGLFFLPRKSMSMSFSIAGKCKYTHFLKKGHGFGGPFLGIIQWKINGLDWLIYALKGHICVDTTKY